MPVSADAFKINKRSQSRKIRKDQNLVTLKQKKIIKIKITKSDKTEVIMQHCLIVRILLL